MPGGDLEPFVAQHGADELVGEHFRSERTYCYGRLLLRRPEAGIDRRRRFVGAVAQRGQIGVENTWRAVPMVMTVSFDASDRLSSA